MQPTFSDQSAFNVTAIGVVKTAVPDAQISKSRKELVSEIIVFPAYTAALAGLEEYSHLIILFWMDRAPPLQALTGHPRGDPAQPEVGVLAMRSRSRPNPLGLAVVDLVERNANSLLVRRLDAYHGSAVIDIKPYDYYDAYQHIRVPDWSNSAPRPSRANSLAT
jgi:tRNA (adenine37-N6)-methyltransferase